MALELGKEDHYTIRRQQELSLPEILGFLDDKFAKQDFWSKNFAFSYEDFHSL